MAIHIEPFQGSTSFHSYPLWIAATASVLDAHLITLDKDFSHLHQNFIQLIQIGFHS